jgi:hypothetical protein
MASPDIIARTLVHFPQNSLFAPCSFCGCEGSSANTVLLPPHDLQNVKASIACCLACVPSGLPAIRIRRCTYFNVVTKREVEKLTRSSVFDDVQTYVSNGLHVFFIQSRPRSAFSSLVGAASTCRIDGRPLMNPRCKFCSIECKMKFVDRRRRRETSQRKQKLPLRSPS